MAQAKARRGTKGFVVLHARFSKEADQWVGECLELGTATQADTIEDLQLELRELIGLHLNTLEKTGQRAQFLKDHGIRMYRTDQTVPHNVW